MAFYRTLLSKPLYPPKLYFLLVFFQSPEQLSLFYFLAVVLSSFNNDGLLFTDIDCLSFFSRVYIISIKLTLFMCAIFYIYIFIRSHFYTTDTIWLLLIILFLRVSSPSLSLCVIRHLIENYYLNNYQLHTIFYIFPM